MNGEKKRLASGADADVRRLLDAALWALLLALMGFHVLPKALHEALGLLLPAVALWHLAQNRHWFAALRRGRWNGARAAAAFLNGALGVSLVLAVISGLAIANRLFHGVFGLYWERSILAHQVHVASAYWLLIFSGLHLGFHWSGLWPRLVRRCGWNPASRRYRKGCRLALFLIAAGGVLGSFLHRVGDRLLMKHVFGTAAARLPMPLFFLVLAAMFGLYAILGHSCQRRLRGGPP